MQKPKTYCLSMIRAGLPVKPVRFRNIGLRRATPEPSRFDSERLSCHGKLLNPYSSLRGSGGFFIFPRSAFFFTRFRAKNVYSSLFQS